MKKIRCARRSLDCTNTLAGLGIKRVATQGGMMLYCQTGDEYINALLQAKMFALAASDVCRSHGVHLFFCNDGVWDRTDSIGAATLVENTEGMPCVAHMKNSSTNQGRKNGASDDTTVLGHHTSRSRAGAYSSSGTFIAGATHHWQTLDGKAFRTAIST